MFEQMQMRNNYRAHNLMGAGYAAVDLPLGKLGVHAACVSSITTWN